MELVRNSLVAARKEGETAAITYLGGGKYKVIVTAEEYKTAERRLKEVTRSVEQAFKRIPASTVTFTREE